MKEMKNKKKVWSEWSLILSKNFELFKIGVTFEKNQNISFKIAPLVERIALLGWQFWILILGCEFVNIFAAKRLANSK